MKKLGVAIAGLVLGLGVWTWAPAPALAQGLGGTTCNKGQAGKHFARGSAFFKQRKYLQAVKELKRAYGICPMPVLLYRIGETFQASGLNDYAAQSYCKFLDEAVVGNPNRAVARSALRTMGHKCKTHATPPPGRRPPRPGNLVKGRAKSCVTGLCHTSVDDADTHQPLALSAQVARNLGAQVQVYLYFRPRGQATYGKVLMKVDRRGVYHGSVPTAGLTRSSLQYYIEVVGISGQRVAGSGTKGEPNIVSLKASAKPRPEITKPPVPKDPPVPGYRPKLYGFMGSTALTIVSFVVGGILSYNARQTARDMANAAVTSPRQTYDPTLQSLEKKGKALDAGAIVCYVVGSLALGTTAYLAYDLWIKKRKERALPTRGIPVGRGVTITPTFGPQSLGLSGGISF